MDVTGMNAIVHFHGHKPWKTMIQSQSMKKYL